MHGHHRKIKVLLTKKVWGVVVASQAALCLTLGDTSLICFQGLSALVKMILMGFDCSSYTESMSALIPVISQVSRGHTEASGSILGM